jgi:hypothetical protein
MKKRVNSKKNDVNTKAIVLILVVVLALGAYFYDNESVTGNAVSETCKRFEGTRFTLDRLQEGVHICDISTFYWPSDSESVPIEVALASVIEDVNFVKRYRSVGRRTAEWYPRDSEKNEANAGRNKFFDMIEPGEKYRIYLQIGHTANLRYP